MSISTGDGMEQTMKHFLTMLILLPALLGATEKTVFREDFEKLIPGQEYKKLGKLWGSSENTMIGGTNESAADGEKSLLFQIDKSKMHGYRLALPDSAGKNMVLEYKFLLDGTGSFGWELRRGASQVLIGWGFGQRGFTAATRIKSNKKRNGRFGMAIDKNIWYSVKLELPGTGSGSDTAKITLTNTGTKVSVSREINWKAPGKNIGFCFNVPAGGGSYRVFIDSIRYFSVE